MDNPVFVPKTRKHALFRAQTADDPSDAVVSTIKAVAESGYEGSRSASDDDEDETNYSSDIASAVATILELAANEPVLAEHSGSSVARPVTVLPAQPSKSKKKVLKSKSTKAVKPKRSKSTIYPSGTNSKTKIRIDSTESNANVIGNKSKSKTSTSIEALNLSHSNSFQAFDSTTEDEPHGTPKGEKEADGKLRQAVCGFRPFPPSPLPRHPNMLDVSLYVGRIIDYFKKLGYNTEGEPKIRVNTRLSLHTLIETARLLVRAGEQIKCLHALVLGIYFTNCTPFIERFTINFKSTVNGKEYKHVVLGLYMFGAFGALGISRDPRLQDKPAIFTRLADLLSNFCQSYSQCGHDLIEIKVGGIISRDPHSLAPLPFKLGIIHLRKILNEQQFTNECDKIGKLLRAQMGPVCLRQVRPPELSKPFPGHEDRKSLLSSTGTTTTLHDESVKFISKLREISTETTLKMPSTSKSTKLSEKSTKATAAKKKTAKK